MSNEVRHNPTRSPSHRPASPTVVCIGGGTGLSTLLRGIKRFDLDVNAIVTVTDDGGSSGRLREELNVLPPGDIRNCLIALSEDETLMTRLFKYRFPSDGALRDHSFGNLFLTAMAGVTGDFVEAVRLASEVLAIQGHIYPSTGSNVKLRADFADGTSIVGESRITAARRKIHRVSLEPERVKALPTALEAIESADLITIGPGSLYTSIIPNLLVDDVIPAIRASRALKIYVQNIMTQPGETDGMTAADHVQALIDHCGGLLFPCILMNAGLPPVELLRTYESDNAFLVEPDYDRLSPQDLRIIERPMVGGGPTIRHDPDRLAEAICEVAGI